MSRPVRPKPEGSQTQSAQPEERLWRRYCLTRADFVLGVALFLLALLVRWPLIAKGETLLHSDEAIVGLMAQDIASGARFPIYFYGQRYMGALEAYVIAAVSPLFGEPVVALRFGPACFFAALVSLQYMMLTRWFGRPGGLTAAVVLLAGAPMFAQWSVSARGGYIEIMLWGAALLWAYAEWFAEPGRDTPRPRHRFGFGAIVGSGLWINPSIVFFILPIAACVLLDRPLAKLSEPGDAVHTQPSTDGSRWFQRLTARTGLCTLPLLALTGLLALNATWAVWVTQRRVHTMLLLGLVPPPVAVGLLAALGAVAVLTVARRANLVSAVRSQMNVNGPLILGILAGATPALIYVARTILGTQPLEDALPLGLRPLWLTGETIGYLVRGLPLLLGADPRPFLQLVSVGRDTVTAPLEATMSTLVSVANWLVLISILAASAGFFVAHRGELSQLLRLRPMKPSPAMLLLLGLLGMLSLYVLGGCTFDFTTLRYLVPMWVFVPGLFGAVVADRRIHWVARLAPIGACAAWALGQAGMVGQLGHPHPLRGLATTLVDRGIDPAIAEPLDAHLLSYLTRQRCRTAEFESFWPRLAHFRPLVEREVPTDYIVETEPGDRTQDWIRGGWPGRPPPETKRFLWPRLSAALAEDPDMLLEREPLVGGYERIRLRRPLPERKPPS